MGHQPFKPPVKPANGQPQPVISAKDHGGTCGGKQPNRRAASFLFPSCRVHTLLFSTISSLPSPVMCLTRSLYKPGTCPARSPLMLDFYIALFHFSHACDWNCADALPGPPPVSSPPPPTFPHPCLADTSAGLGLSLTSLARDWTPLTGNAYKAVNSLCICESNDLDSGDRFLGQFSRGKLGKNERQHTTSSEALGRHMTVLLQQPGFQKRPREKERSPTPDPCSIQFPSPLDPIMPNWSCVAAGNSVVVL